VELLITEISIKIKEIQDIKNGIVSKEEIKEEYSKTSDKGILIDFKHSQPSESSNESQTEYGGENVWAEKDGST